MQRPSDADARRSGEPASPPLRLGTVLAQSLPGRLLALTSLLLVVLVVAGSLIELPYALDWLRRVTWVSWLVGVGWLILFAALRARQVVLWRVRRKLLLSYVFFGVVPVVLVVAFSLAASVLLYATGANYIFLESYADHIRTVRDIAETSAIEVRRSPELAEFGLERRYDNLRDRHPALSLALVPVNRDGARRLLAAGAWAHAPVPQEVPEWVLDAGEFAGTLAVAGADGGAPQLVIRAAVPTADGTAVAVVDLPIDSRFTAALQDETGISMARVVVEGCGQARAPAPLAVQSRWTIFEETSASLDCRAWASGEAGRAAVALVAPLGDLYASLAAFNVASGGTATNLAAVVPLLLWLLAGLFLVIQASAVVMGVLLARSITSAVHELFEGTERVRAGDFAHRIRIDSNDQLGALATSFNRMSESIERLLHIEREKQRLDDELRIAREIQKSLLPERPPDVEGLDIVALCEPAREVGGDYYDFFPLGARQLGVMIADVSGKGPSAALYMAELKGVMLALNRAGRRPRELLIEANRLLAAHLDTRSFITMTYVAIDVAAARATVVRAGHTPAIHVAGGSAAVLAPDGMALGLALPQDDEMFGRVLVEQDLELAVGDVLVLYTDGVTDTTNPAGDLFGDDALADVVTRHRHLGAAGIRDQVLRDVADFGAGAEAHDDMTMVIIAVNSVGEGR